MNTRTTAISLGLTRTRTVYNNKTDIQAVDVNSRLLPAVPNQNLNTANQRAYSMVRSISCRTIVNKLWGSIRLLHMLLFNQLSVINITYINHTFHRTITHRVRAICYKYCAHSVRHIWSCTEPLTLTLNINICSIKLKWDDKQLKCDMITRWDEYK